jgi:hypothetical protein
MGYHVLYLVRGESIGYLIEYAHLKAVFLKGEGLLLDVEALVDSSLPKYVLLNWSIDHQAI